MTEMRAEFRKLKACPFCGADGVVFHDSSIVAETGEKYGERLWFVWCTECSALVCDKTENAAIEAWNRRAG